jgi:hypothetical protein
MWMVKGKRRYYYRGRRRGGQVRLTYVGPGAVGEAAEAEDRRRRAERGAAREAARDERQRYAGSVRPLGDITRLSAVLTRATLMTSGMRWTRQRKWRPHRPVG